MLLLESKLNPPGLRHNLVQRAHLIERLTDGIQQGHPLTLISAPAGYGKSTLAAEWLNHMSDIVHAAAWVSMDKNENDAIRFWTYVLAGLEKIYPGQLQEFFLGLESTNQPNLLALLSDVLNTLGCMTQKGLLILDDLHHIHNPDIFSQLTFFLEYLPDSLVLVLLTRVDPPLPLPRFRAQGFLSEIRASDLVFSETESELFIRDTLGMAIGETVSHQLFRLTEGWAAGLQMAGLSLKHKPGCNETSTFRGENKKIILDFLFHEVFRQQTALIQTILLSTAIVDQFCVDLAARLTQALSPQASRVEVAEAVRQIEEANLFLIPLDESGQWYRYHHLFADLLRYAGKERFSEQQKALTHAAAGWYWEQWKRSDVSAGSRQYDWLNAAMQYGILAEEWGLVSGWLKQVWKQTCHESKISLVEAWLIKFPQDLIRQDVELLGAFAWVMWLQGRLQEAEPFVNQAFAVLGVEPGGNGLESLPAEHNHLLTLLSFFTMKNSLFRNAQHIALYAYQNSSPSDPLGQGVSGYFLANLYRVARQVDKAEAIFREAYPALMSGHNYVGAAAAVYHAAQILLHQGKLSQAEKFCQEAIVIAHNQNIDHLADYGAVWSALAAVQLARGEFLQAESSLNEAMQRLRYSQLNEMKRGALRVEYQLSRLTGKTKQAAQQMKQLVETTRQTETSFVQIEVDADQALYWLAQGQATQAYAWLENGILTNLMKAPNHNDYLGANAAAAQRILVDQKNVDTVVGLCERLQPGFQALGLTYDLIHLHLWRAAAFLICGKKEAALQDLKTAISLAAPERIKLVFLEADSAVQKLLFQVQAQNTVEKLFLEDLMRSLSSPASEKHGAADLIEALTEREFEILTLMEQGYSNQDIADKLFITIYTVKKHSGNIFGKLGVNTRTQAIAKARALNLI